MVFRKVRNVIIVALAVFAIYLMNLYWLALQQQGAIRQVRKFSDCVLSYDGKSASMLDLTLLLADSPQRLPELTWAESILGYDFVHRCSGAEINFDQLENALPALSRLPYLTELSVVQFHKGPLDSDATAFDEQATRYRIEQKLPKVKLTWVRFLLNGDDQHRVRLPREL